MPTRTSRASHTREPASLGLACRAPRGPGSATASVRSSARFVKKLEPPLALIVAARSHNPSEALGREALWARRRPEALELFGVAAVAADQFSGAGVDAFVQVMAVIRELFLDRHQGALDPAQLVKVIPGNGGVPQPGQLGQPAIHAHIGDPAEGGRAAIVASLLEGRAGGQPLGARAVAGQSGPEQIQAALHQAAPGAHLALLLAQCPALGAQAGKRLEPQAFGKALLDHDRSLQQDHIVSLAFSAVPRPHFSLCGGLASRACLEPRSPPGPPGPSRGAGVPPRSCAPAPSRSRSALPPAIRTSPPRSATARRGSCWSPRSSRPSRPTRWSTRSPRSCSGATRPWPTSPRPRGRSWSRLSTGPASSVTRPRLSRKPPSTCWSTTAARSPSGWRTWSSCPVSGARPRTSCSARSSAGTRGSWSTPT